MAKSVSRSRVAAWCAQCAHATLDFPFGEQTAVYKVGGKMFALLPVKSDRLAISLKVEPDEGVALRAEYEGVSEGYHLNKRHWITVAIDSDVPAPVLSELIEESHRLVVASLPAKVRREMAPP